MTRPDTERRGWMPGPNEDALPLAGFTDEEPGAPGRGGDGIFYLGRRAGEHCRPDLLTLRHAGCASTGAR